MSPAPRNPKDIAASIRARLLNYAREHRESFQAILTRYAIERLLYRLSKSKHAGQFVLKGAALFVVWTGSVHRPTKDLDLLGYGEDSEERLAAVMRDLCGVDVEPDGLEFDTASITVEAIREDQERYQGKRIKLIAYLARARIPLQIDVGFGDAITPAPSEVQFPTLLADSPVPTISAYPQATAVAEKFEAMVKLGMDNSRMKDFYDLWLLSRAFDFDTDVLAAAIRATFNRRGTPLPEAFPATLVDDFANDSVKIAQWKAYRAKSKLEKAPENLVEVVKSLHEFLRPALDKKR
jgi:predicted nucleotidyltransferase component of viral defense system